MTARWPVHTPVLRPFDIRLHIHAHTHTYNYTYTHNHVHLTTPTRCHFTPTCYHSIPQ